MNDTNGVLHVGIDLGTSQVPSRRQTVHATSSIAMSVGQWIWSHVEC